MDFIKMLNSVNYDDTQYGELPYNSKNKNLIDFLSELRDTNKNKILSDVIGDIHFNEMSKIKKIKIEDVIKNFPRINNDFWPKNGEIIGRCKIISLLGKGYTSNVYKAVHEFLNIEVAIKILSEDVRNNNPDIENMFLREAQNTAKLNHPNLVSVFDADKGKKYTYIVMEFIDGYDLENYISKNGALKYIDSINIIIKICDALNYALDKNIIHRDIKPGNIMVSKNNDIKLLDLGLSKIINSNINEEGCILGTPIYMSPEQLVNPSEVDYTTDIYSLGVTFYHLITGNLPFNNKSYREMITQKILLDDFKSDLQENIHSEPLNKIINKLICKNKKDRYQSYELIKKDLLELLI